MGSFNHSKCSKNQGKWYIVSVEAISVNFRGVRVHYMSTTSDKMNVDILTKLWILLGNAILASVKIILTVSVLKYQR